MSRGALRHEAAAPSDREWDAAIRARLRERLPALLPGHVVVGDIHPWAQDVWLVRLADGGCVVAKHQVYGLLTRGEPHDLLQVEFDALRQLRAAGCPVPLVFGIDPGAQLILLEFVGRRTLADLLAGGPPPRLCRRILRGLLAIEQALASAGDAWAGRVVPGAAIEDLTARWSAVPAAAVAGLQALWRVCLGREAPGDVAAAVVDLARDLGARQPRLGVTDYQPANIVVDDLAERLTFLEFSKLGWDWTERRAVQYTSSTDGSGSALLDAQDIAHTCVDAAALDGHHLLFQLLLAQRLWGGAEPPAALRSGPGPGFTRSLTAGFSGDPRARWLRRALRPLHTSRESDR